MVLLMLFCSARDQRQAGVLRQEDAEGDEGSGHGRRGDGARVRHALRVRHGPDQELLPAAVQRHASKLDRCKDKQFKTYQRLCKNVLSALCKF